MWHMGDGWGWWMVMGWLWMAVFWGLVIWAVYALDQRTGDHAHRHDTAEHDGSALEILERRYARGELSDAAFEAMRERLSPSPGAAAPTNGRSSPLVK